MNYFRLIPILSFLFLMSACSSGPPKEVLQKALENRYLGSSDPEFQLSKITTVSSESSSVEAMGYKEETVRLVLNASFAAKADCLARKSDAEHKSLPSCTSEAQFKQLEAETKEPSTNDLYTGLARGRLNNYIKLKAQGGQNVKAGDEFEIKKIAVNCSSSPNEKPKVWRCRF